MAVKLLDGIGRNLVEAKREDLRSAIISTGGRVMVGETVFLMIKAIFLDLDGTLLNAEKKITDKTRKALKACKEKGIKIFPATGRPPLLKYILPLSQEELELFDHSGVFYNGACVLYEQWKKYETIDEKIIHAVRKAAGNYPDLYISFQMKDEKHSFSFGIQEQDYSTWGITEENIVPYDKYDHKDTVKIYIFSHNYSIDLYSVYNDLMPLIGSTSSMYLTYEGKTIEIVGKNVSCIFRPHPDTDSGNIRTAFRNYPDSITAYPDTLSND